MSKRKSYQPTQTPLAAFWEGTAPFRGPLVSMAGMGLFVLNRTEFQIAGMILMVFGGLLIGEWARKRTERKAAEKLIAQKLEKKQARKAARAAKPAGGEDQESEDDNTESDTA